MLKFYIWTCRELKLTTLRKEPNANEKQLAYFNLETKQNRLKGKSLLGFYQQDRNLNL